MTSKTLVEDFINQKSLAVVGVSRQKQKFGNSIYLELKKQGYRVYPINPNMDTMEGEHCYPSLKALPEPVGGVVIVVSPSHTDQIVREAQEVGISRVWMQQGSESTAAIKYCQENQIKEIHGECLLMFVNASQFPHNFHRWIWGMVGKLPN